MSTVTEHRQCYFIFFPRVENFFLIFIIHFKEDLIFLNNILMLEYTPSNFGFINY